MKHSENSVIDTETSDMISVLKDLSGAIKARKTAQIKHLLIRLEHALLHQIENDEKRAAKAGIDNAGDKLAQQFMLKDLRFLKSQLTSVSFMQFDGALPHFSNFFKYWMVDDPTAGTMMRIKPIEHSHCQSIT